MVPVPELFGEINLSLRSFRAEVEILDEIYAESASWLPSLRMGRQAYSKGQCIRSPTFTLNEMTGFSITLYPKGDMSARKGYCSVYVEVPKPGHFQIELVVEGETTVFDAKFTKKAMLQGFRDMVVIPETFDEIKLGVSCF